ncbi:MAG TPA: hypothetical protein HA343_01755 [Methanomassiliicoccales archaeon]|nr:hypothetical protein [Methanomassiliicoccales archaeon]
MDGIQAEAAVGKALHGWAITRIPPTMSTYWHLRPDPVSLVNLSHVILQEDLVQCGRELANDGWPSALKL